MEKFVKILKKLFPFTIILILVYFVPPIFILVQQEEEVIERMLTADLMILIREFLLLPQWHLAYATDSTGILYFW